MATPLQHPLTDERREAAIACAGLADRGPVVASEPLGGAWAPVTRLRFAGGDPVVVKTRRVEAGGWGGPHHLRREAVALAVLDADAQVAATLLGFDDRAGVVVTTDVGAGVPTVEDVLLGDDPDAATSAMLAFGAAVGRLHASTAGVEGEHRERLAEVGTDATRDRLGQWPGIERFDEVVEAATSLGLAEPSARAADEVDGVLAELRSPARADGGLIHLDLAPHNALVAEDGVRLVDWEGSTYGHTGLDACFLHYPFPNYSAHWATLPAEVVDAADAAYREARGPSLSAEHHARALAVGAAALLVLRAHRLPVLASSGQTPHDSWRRRAQLVQQVGVFSALRERAGVLPALRRWFIDLAAAMADRWSDATSPPPPTFPAFRAGASSPVPARPA